MTPKQKMFARQYLIDLNATQAAIRAGYSRKYASETGRKILKRQDIATMIRKDMEKRAKRLEITADMLLQEIAKLAFSDVRRIFDDQGRLLPVSQLPPDVAASVSSVKVVTSSIPRTDPVEVVHTSEIKFWDKKGALELLGKHLKLFTDKLEHSGSVTVGLAERIKAARERSGK